MYSPYILLITLIIFMFRGKGMVDRADCFNMTGQSVLSRGVALVVLAYLPDSVGCVRLMFTTVADWLGSGRL